MLWVITTHNPPIIVFFTTFGYFCECRFLNYPCYFRSSSDLFYPGLLGETSRTSATDNTCVIWSKNHHCGMVLTRFFWLVYVLDSQNWSNMLTKTWFCSWDMSFVPQMSMIGCLTCGRETLRSKVYQNLRFVICICLQIQIDIRKKMILITFSEICNVKKYLGPLQDAQWVPTSKYTVIHDEPKAFGL